MKPGSSISLQRRGKGEYNPAKIEPEPTELLSFVVCYSDTSGEELQSVRVSREQLKDVQKAIGEYLEKTETEDVQSVEAAANESATFSSKNSESTEFSRLLEIIQEAEQRVTDAKSKNFRLNPDNVRITKSTCNPQEETREAVVGDTKKFMTFVIYEYFAEINCNLFSLKVGGRSPEEAKANLDERFAELTQALFR